MRKRIAAFIAFLVPFIILSQNGLKEVSNFGYNPGNLSLFTYNGNERSFTAGKPLVIAMHGCAMTADKLCEITDWNLLALKNDFIVFYPQQKLINNPSNCFNWFYESDINRNGECLSIYNMIRYALDSLKADSTKIFLYGVSAGACMSEVVSANFPWLINTAAIYAGIPYRAATGSGAVRLLGKTQIKDAKEWGDLVRTQTPYYKGTYPKMIVLHGTEDFVTDFGYSDEIIKQWTNVHQISDKPVVRDTAFMNNKKIQRFVYGNKSKPSLIYYKMIGLSHKIAVDIGTNENEGGKDKLFSEDIDFFSTYYIAKDFGLIKNGK